MFGKVYIKSNTSIRDPHYEVMLSRSGVSSFLMFCPSRGALPTLRYFPKDTKLALGMTLLELHWILQVFCVRKKDNRGS